MEKPKITITLNDTEEFEMLLHAAYKGVDVLEQTDESFDAAYFKDKIINRMMVAQNDYYREIEKYDAEKEKNKCKSHIRGR